MDSREFRVPWLMTKGNHDITGPGAARAFDTKLLPRLAKAVGAEAPRSSYGHHSRGTLFVCYDAYDKGSLDWFENLLTQTRPRRLVFAIHPPVVPYNARATWHVYSSPKQAAERTRLLELLGSHRALVLCGHLHKFSFLVRRTSRGRFSQLAISSVASSADGRIRDELRGCDAYRADLVDLEPKHSPDTVQLRREILNAEKPFIEEFEYADTWGHAILRGSAESQVTAEIFKGLDEHVWKRIAVGV